MTKHLIIILTLVFGCNETEKNRLDLGPKESIEFHPNGFIRSYRIDQSDSVYEINYYNQYDSGRIDSLYKYRLFYDTIIPHERYIYNNHVISEALKIEKVKLDSGDYYKFRLIKPDNDFISIYIKRNQGNWKKDTTIWALDKNTLRRTYSDNVKELLLKDLGDSLIRGYIIDWGVFSKGDTIGTIGHVMKRYLKFEIKKQTPISAPEQL